ncbi:hypothetical protein Holit_03072 [Hollandina sp. SP2]
MVLYLPSRKAQGVHRQDGIVKPFELRGHFVSDGVSA